ATIQPPSTSHRRRTAKRAQRAINPVSWATICPCICHHHVFVVRRNRDSVPSSCWHHDGTLPAHGSSELSNEKLEKPSHHDPSGTGIPVLVNDPADVICCSCVERSHNAPEPRGGGHVMLQPAERADARANRLRLIAAAHEVFREQGVDAEMKTIAERAGVGVGTIYRNFPTKDDLITAIVVEAIDRLGESVAAALATEDPIEAVRMYIERGCAISEEYGDTLMAVLSGSMPPACREAFQRKDEVGDIS